MVGDLGLDSLFNDIAREKKELKKKRKSNLLKR